MSPSITGILLAAGQSRRFGADKLMQPLADGSPLAVAAARHLHQAVPDTLVVVDSAGSALAARLRDEGVQVVVNARAAAGMGTSIAAGVAAAAQASGWVIALGDMPFIEPETIARVAAALTGEHVIGAPVYRGQRGHPVAFGRDYRDLLLQLDGDTGARRILKACPSRLFPVPTNDPGVLRDIDRPADLEVVP